MMKTKKNIATAANVNRPASTQTSMLYYYYCHYTEMFCFMQYVEVLKDNLIEHDWYGIFKKRTDIWWFKNLKFWCTG